MPQVRTTTRPSPALRSRAAASLACPGFGDLESVSDGTAQGPVTYVSFLRFLRFLRAFSAANVTVSSMVDQVCLYVLCVCFRAFKVKKDHELP